MHDQRRGHARAGHIFGRLGLTRLRLGFISDSRLEGSSEVRLPGELRGGLRYSNDARLKAAVP